MRAAVSYERVRDQLATLGLEAALTSLDPVLARGQQDQKVAVEVLDELLGLEFAARFERRIATNRKLSGLPTLKTLEAFDFAAQPEVAKPTVDELATLRFLHQGENVLLLGPRSVGKTHLATGLALTALARGHRIYFLTLHDLVTKSRAARDRNRLGMFMQMLLRPALLILDEILSAAGAARRDVSVRAREQALSDAEVDHPHEQQELRAVGRDLPRHRTRDRAPGPAPPPRHDDHHPRGKLPPPASPPRRPRRPAPQRGRHDPAA